MVLGVTPEQLEGECIDAIEQLNFGFNLGNAVKYLWRCGQKGSAIEDLEKAKWYLARVCIQADREAQDRCRTAIFMIDVLIRAFRKLGATPPKEIGSDPDFGATVVCALRYCMGRKTYMPSTIVAFAKRHWQFISENDRVDIAKDIHYAFKQAEKSGDYSSIGMDCDIRLWSEFRDWIQEQP
ncbi:hypothetical protein LBWT_A0520 (plasmid) [Leptolyngbya boryana IAM M-101]|nr:hypothetical protein LBWT_A0520 [Leptolyngbya boryana IAM M-101]BAS66230.1 hypothetical protein LBDG_A0520 [Leptolyngbya boryana dg5]